MTAVALPDAEALLIQALKAKPTVTVQCGGRIGTRLGGVYPAIRVTLLGGSSRQVENTGRPELQIECWGDGSDATAETQAALLAQTIEAEVASLAGSYSVGQIVGAVVYGGILHSAPDTTTGRERYILQIGLLTQP
jgi:hypothetical protein